MYKEKEKKTWNKAVTGIRLLRDLNTHPYGIKTFFGLLFVSLADIIYKVVSSWNIKNGQEW